MSTIQELKQAQAEKLEKFNVPKEYIEQWLKEHPKAAQDAVIGMVNSQAMLSVKANEYTDSVETYLSDVYGCLESELDYRVEYYDDDDNLIEDPTDDEMDCGGEFVFEIDGQDYWYPDFYDSTNAWIAREIARDYLEQLSGDDLVQHRIKVETNKVNALWTQGAIDLILEPIRAQGQVIIDEYKKERAQVDLARGETRDGIDELLSTYEKKWDEFRANYKQLSGDDIQPFWWYC